jgi:DNA-binding NtrC family response regulator
VSFRSGFFYGTSAAIQALQEDLEDAARSDAKVLITGESGVGKELAARTVHTHSRRCSAPLVALNSAGVPDTLLESELFGHTRGSFTGAYRDKLGIFELARSGTVLLDEVGEMSLRMQSLLLRFLETGEIQPVGSDRPRTRVDVRVIAMTNRHLLDQIAAKAFREDLYYRLNVIHVIVPPLRDRREDIPALVNQFLRGAVQQYGTECPVIADDAMARLMEYDWPGNVRELKNVIERCLVRARGRSIAESALPHEVQTRRAPAAAARQEPARRSVAELAFDQIVNGHESFWSVVYEPFMSRDLTRDDVRQIVRMGLERTQGNYRVLVGLFNMRKEDYKRFLSCLAKYQCRLQFQQFRVVPEPAKAAAHEEPAGCAADRSGAVV